MPDAPTLEEFEEAALAFLEARVPRRPEARSAFGEGSDEVALFPELSAEQERSLVEEAKRWAREVYDAGFGWITGPPEYGGRGLSAEHARRYAALEARFVTPSQAPRGIGLGMVAPTILAHGTEAAKRRYLRPLWRGDIIACQLFSEPGAGSDLASVATRATRDGDEWVLEGQKVWTSGAHYSDIGEILCRSDPDAPKHRGLSAFLVDMHAPGVEVRPLRQMTGGASFNEVFLTGVRVPADHLLGEPNDGWRVALTTLMNERAAIGGGGAGPGTGYVARLVELSRHLGRSGDPLVRQQLADLVVRVEVARLTTARALGETPPGSLPSPLLSLAKLALTENLRRASDVATTLLGCRLAADGGGWGTYAWARFVLGVPGMRVAGGTDEVMRTILGERVLGLPKEPPAA
jgi:alkylation response protein AidB-like acyl-CoA dehydrogenase